LAKKPTTIAHVPTLDGACATRPLPRDGKTSVCEYLFQCFLLIYKNLEMGRQKQRSRKIISSAHLMDIV